MFFITGVISGKSFLPITRLNFGRTQLTSSFGVHTLGRFECTGQGVVSGRPKSCVDLWQIGHTLSGLYSVMGDKQIESVFCDFTKIPTDSGRWKNYSSIIRVKTTCPRVRIAHSIAKKNGIHTTSIALQVSKRGLDTMTSNRSPSTSSFRKIIISMHRARRFHLNWKH